MGRNVAAMDYTSRDQVETEAGMYLYTSDFLLYVYMWSDIDRSLYHAWHVTSPACPDHSYSDPLTYPVMRDAINV